ncbi:MAG TPA: hypothetical protein VF299_01370 [Mycobacterium sp.]
MLRRWRGFRRAPVAARVRVAALVVGVAAALALGVVGCTTIIGGDATVDTSAAPAYRSSVSASAATSSSRESQRQLSMTTQAVRGACVRFAKSSTTAVETVNKYVDAFNSGGDVSDTAGPAIEALNDSADTISGAVSNVLSPALRDVFNSYAESARSLAQAISTHASTPVYNSRKEELNNIRGKGMQLCKSY